jgi:hypothetical protein
MGKLTFKAKKSLIFLFSIIGTLTKDDFWQDIKVSRKAKDKTKEVAEKAEELATMLNLEEKEFEQLLKDIKRKVYSVEVFHDAELQEKHRQVRKLPVKIQKEYLDDLIEIACTNCLDCKRNTKQCGQRKLFKKMGIEAYDPGKTESKCEYWYATTMKREG